MDTGRFDLISLLFTVLAVLGLPRLLRGWRALVAPEPSAEGEALAVYVAVFIAVPLATLAHELGHLTVARLLGATDATLHYRIFWGYVDYRTRLEGHGDWWVALAGNAVSWALAALSLLAAHASLPPGLRSTARTFGMLEMVHTLVAYPLLSLSSLPGADWTVIYGRPFWAGMAVVAVIHMASLAWLRRELRDRPAAEAVPETAAEKAEKVGGIAEEAAESGEEAPVE
jgi:hypothetical protein